MFIGTQGIETQGIGTQGIGTQGIETQGIGSWDPGHWAATLKKCFFILTCIISRTNQNQQE